MTLNIKTLVTLNLSVQALLLILVLVAAYLAISKRDYTRHCTLVRIAVPVQIIAIASVMLPSLLGYVRVAPFSALSIEILAHHTVGLAVIILWIYINLAFSGAIKMIIRLRPVMRLALASWVTSFLIGLHLYWFV